jgi:hypothetical protein
VNEDKPSLKQFLTEPESLPESPFKQDLEILSTAVEKAAEARAGSFSQRNPLLGRMRRCPFCRQRRRANTQESCCNAKYSIQHESAPHIKRRKNPRLSRNRPPLFQMRQVLLELEAEPLLIGPLQDSIEGLEGFHTPQKEVRMEHLATFVERMIIRSRKQKAKKYRDRQKLSRKVNR